MKKYCQLGSKCAIEAESIEHAACQLVIDDSYEDGDVEIQVHEQVQDGQSYMVHQFKVNVVATKTITASLGRVSITEYR